MSSISTLGVLDGVVQERGRERRLVELQAGEDLRRAPGVVDELLAGAAQLPVVGVGGEAERPRQELPVDVGLVELDLGDAARRRGPGVVSSTAMYPVYPAERPQSHSSADPQETARSTPLNATTCSVVARAARTAAPDHPVARRARQPAGLSGVARRLRRIAQAASRERPAPRAAPGTTPTRAGSAARPSPSSSSANTARASGVQPLSPRAPLLGEPGAQLRVALVGVEDPPHDELRRDGPVPAVLLRGGTRRRSGRSRRKRSSCEPQPEGDRRAGVAAPLAHAEAQVLALRRRCRARSARTPRRAA